MKKEKGRKKGDERWNWIQKRYILPSSHEILETSLLRYVMQKYNSCEAQLDTALLRLRWVKSASAETKVKTKFSQEQTLWSKIYFKT